MIFALSSMLEERIFVLFSGWDPIGSQSIVTVCQSVSQNNAFVVVRWAGCCSRRLDLRCLRRWEKRKSNRRCCKPFRETMETPMEESIDMQAKFQLYLECSNEYFNFVVSMKDLVRQDKLPKNTLDLIVTGMRERQQSTTCVQRALAGGFYRWKSLKHHRN